MLLCAALAALAAPSARADGGPFGIDYRPAYDNAGIWKRNYQEILEFGAPVVLAFGALWEGGDDRLGKTFWQSIDSTVAAGLLADGLKYAFSRDRPYQLDNPNAWFTTGGRSFPSGEVTEISSIVTPFVLEYGKEDPAVYALELLPVYDAIGRVKVWGHWQSDVIAGFGLGFASGYLMHSLKTPLILRVMPHGIQVGLKMQF
ncbi:MAG TPA: phosphatase PAP2 family protein [Steroidobacteraceae bacterium]|nr:phosphatase PAP2 family protein [Steroidobacteraceae bacterium]